MEEDFVLVVSTQQSSDVGAVEIFDPETGQLLAQSQVEGLVATGIDFGPTGNLFVGNQSSEDVTVAEFEDAPLGLIDLDSIDPAAGAFDIEFGPNGNLFVLTPFNFEVFSGTTGASLGTADVSMTFVNAGGGFTFGPNGNIFVINSGLGTIVEFDPATETIVNTSLGAGLDGRDLAFDESGNLFVLTNTNILAQNATGAEIFATGFNVPTSLAFGPNGNLFVTNSGDNTILEFDSVTGALVNTVTTQGTPNRITFSSPDIADSDPDSLPDDGSVGDDPIPSPDDDSSAGDSPVILPDFIGSELQLEIFSPNFDTPIITPVSAVVGDNIEFSTPLPGQASTVVPFTLDISENSIVYQVAPSTTPSLFDSGAFNGYVLTDAAGTLPAITGVTVDTSATTLDIDAIDISAAALSIDDSDITFNEDQIFINVESLPFSPGDTFTLNVLFEDGSTFPNNTTTLEDDVIVGTDSDDTLRGNNGNDILFGVGGNDLIFGGRGNDTVDGGTGNDTLRGLAGNDILTGGSGNDDILGNSGNDILRGNLDEDLLVGGEGDDRLNGGANDDTLRGAKGNDVLIGGSGRDTIFGGQGDDRLFGGVGRDTLRAGAGNDRLDGGSANDIIRTGNGNDRVVLRAVDGTDRIFRFDTQGNDRILLEGISFGQISLDVDDGNTAIVFNEQTLAVVINNTNLTQDDFISI